MLEACFAPRPGHSTADVIEDALAVGQAIGGGVDERVILCVKLAEGTMLSMDMETRIKTEIRARRTARHVPARVSPFRPLCLANWLDPRSCRCRISRIL